MSGTYPQGETDSTYDEMASLRMRLEEAEETLRAIRSGEVDALVVNTPLGQRLYTLEGAERPYRVFIEEMQQGALTVSFEGVILYANPRFAEMVGAADHLLTGRSLFDFFGSADGTRAADILREAQTGKAEGELALGSGQGSVMPIYLTASVSPGDESIIRCIVTDLTDRKRQEEALIAQAAAREDLRRKDEFLAILAHELRNPLAPILYALHILKSPAADPVVTSNAGDVIRRQVDLLVRLIDDLLDVSRIAQGRIHLERQTVDLTKIVSRAMEMVIPLVNNRKQELRVDLPADPIQLEADPDRLTQIIGNILNNATKYTPDRGGIVLRAEEAGDEVVIRVTDSGIGIEPEFLPHVFDMFMQADAHSARGQRGLGIGLCLVRRLVELHGGRVEAFSAGRDQGSEFVVHLPALSIGAPPSAGSEGQA
jgi:PAS domain S-box-containing protein